MSLRKALREFVAEQIAQPGEHKKAELAAAFLDENPELAAEYLRELAERHVASLVKELCDLHDEDPLPIFSGFPTAIAVAPGVVKATANCTLADLNVGLENRRENVRHAQDKFRQYAESMTAYASLRSDEAETVGDCQARLRESGAGELPTPTP